MPLYEYESTEDGEIITLLRPMADADSPVEDPSGRDRTFRRRHSVFGVGSGDGQMAEVWGTGSWGAGGGKWWAGCGDGGLPDGRW